MTEPTEQEVEADTFDAIDAWQESFVMGESPAILVSRADALFTHVKRRLAAAQSKLDWAEVEDAVQWAEQILGSAWPVAQPSYLRTLLAVLAAERKDAERYRWLCDGNGFFMEEKSLCGYSNQKADADDAIDAAIAESTK